jgi:Oxidoreductase molybdopterin binding domain
MSRATSVCVMSLAAVLGLHGQGIRQPKPLPPNLVPATITVIGINGTTATLSTSDLSKLPQQTVKVLDHGTPATFEGVLLTDVLAKVELPVGEKFHSTAASYYLVVEAQDRYRAVFAWAELDSTFMDKAVYVVTSRDGKPLSGNDGPFELVVPGEKRSARWVRQLTALKIRQAN